MLTSKLREAWTRVISYFRKSELDKEFSEELISHVDLAADEYVRRGLTPAEARRRALVELGGVEATKEIHRESRGVPALDSLLQDFRFAVRGMRRNPGFTLTVVAMLTLGIGANTAIFSLLHAVVLRPLPARTPNELVELLSVYPGDSRLNSFWWKHFELFRDKNHVFSDMTAVSPTPLQVSIDGGDAEAVPGAYVAGNFFSLLGLESELGRLIQTADDQLDSADPVAVLSWSYWNSRFLGDPAIIGAQIVVEGKPTTIIGVAPRDFSGLQLGSPERLWVPSRMSDRRATGGLSMQVLARLKPGLSLEQAQTQMRIIDRQRLRDLFEFRPNPKFWRIRLDVEPAAAGFSRLRERYSKPLIALMAASCLVLLLMCVNLSGMLLARAEAREREMAVRVSLGAGRLRLLRQTLTESLTISFFGGVAGIAAAHVGSRLLIEVVKSARRPPGAPPLELSPQFDPQVLMFSLALAAIVSVVTGLAPALRAIAADPMNALRSTRSAMRPAGRALGRTLVLLQVALSVVLLSAAGLFISHLSNLRHVGLGFDRDHILLATIESPADRLELGRTLERYRTLLDTVQAIPGVRSVSFAGATPISGAAASDFIVAEGFEEPPEERSYALFNVVGPKYFETFGIPVLAGREFRSGDWQNGRIAIVNEALAVHYFPNDGAIGKHITFDRDGTTYEIVGLVGNAKYYELHDPPPPTVYVFPYERATIFPFINLVLRTEAPAKSLLRPITRNFRKVFDDRYLVNIKTMAEQIDQSIVPERLTALLAGLFGVLGAALAGLGLYGSVAYGVARRTHEIGIRLALGARRSNVVAMVLRSTLASVIAGLALGTAISLWARPFAARVFGNLPLSDPTPIVAGTAAMLAAALVAGWIPARRAYHVNPVVALRQD